MPQAFSVPNFGFFTAVRDTLSAFGSSTAGNFTFDYFNSLHGPSALVGTAVVVPGTGNGLRVTGINGSVDPVGGLAASLRLIICSMPGDPAALVGAIENLSFAIGAFLTGASPSLLAQGGLVIPDITTGQLSPTTIFAGAPGAFNGLVPFAPSGLHVHFDSVDGFYNGTNQGRKFSFDGRGAIPIPPNTNVAGLFICNRFSDGGTFDGTMQYSIPTVGGSLEGFALTAAEAAALADGGYTPARFGNVEVPGSL